MAVPAFGFSFGDLIAGIGLIRDLITALQDGAGAKLQYRRLITELINLERVLTEVRFLKVDDHYVSQKIALEQMSMQCQENIEDFLRRNAKFSTTLGAQTTFSKWSWRANLHKIQWAMCKEDAVDKLRAEIRGHTLTINTLLATIHLSATALQTESAKNHQTEIKEHREATDKAETLAKQNHSLLSTQAELILVISQNIASSSTRQQAEELQLVMLKVLNINMKIYKMVLDMQTLQFQLPLQVDRQQPVYFEDAHGRVAPFHTEFISSFDAFQAVIEVRFHHVPGLKKVQNIEYTIQDSSSKRKLDLTAPWDSIFLPGRKMTMSMVFRRLHMSMSSCPGCQTENKIEGSNIESEVQCPNEDCKMWYQRIVEVDALHKAPLSTQKIQQGKRKRKATPFSLKKRSKRSIIVSADNSSEEAAEESEDEDQIRDFQRVYVVHKYPLSTSSLHEQRNCSSGVVDSVPFGPEIPVGYPSSNEDVQPNVPQIYTAVYSKILMYEMEIHGVAVMRRSSDSWLNATQILKVAGIDKRQRAKIIEREILIGEHEKIQGGFGKSQGVWINFERGVKLCRQYGVEEQLRPLLDYDVGQDRTSIAERGFETLTKEEVTAMQQKRPYNWSRMAKSWSGPQNYTALATTTEYHSFSYTTGSRVRTIGGHLSDASLQWLQDFLILRTGQIEES